MENLVTHSINGHNRTKSEGLTSVYIGVHEVDRGFKAAITCNRKCTIIGYYENEKLAAIAYNEKAEELYKEYANLNQIPCFRIKFTCV